MKKIFIFMIVFFSFVITPKAYVRIDTNTSSYITPKSYSGIMNVNSPWDYNAGTESNLLTPWLTSPSHFWSASGLSGEYLNVGADYYIGVWNILTNADMLNYSGNLTPDKLRCGIGNNYRTGYDSTFAPTVSNFKVEYFENKNINGFSQFLFHITFNYSQKIKPVNINSSNMTCWFENDNSLFAQPISTQANQVMYYYYTKDFSYSVSKDANTGLLQDLTSQNNTIIQQNEEIKNAIGGAAASINSNLDGLKDSQNQTNEKLDDLNNSLTSEEGPDLSGLENSSGWLPAGPVDSILNLPLSLLNNLSVNLDKNCNPVNLPLPYVNKNLSLPCISSIYGQIDGLNAWITVIGTIASAFILFSYLMKLYKWVDDTLTFRENNYIDNWGGI